MLKFVQPSFNIDNFERDRLKFAEEAKARQAIKQQDKERRRAILQKMVEKNKELFGEDAGEAVDNGHKSQDLDCLDDTEELAMLGKRYKASIGIKQDPGPGHVAEKKVYGVMRPPAARDVEEDEVKDEAGRPTEREEGQTIKSPLEMLSERIQNKQKASGY